MIDFYNAFISYKHAPLDTKVAEHVQRNLEHFHIPHALRKKTGRKKIERVFRDKDELPITSDLTDTISNALEKADYLIVICSPNTKKSIWVEREINFFLRNHTKDQILTVLADGEPEDVIPDILKYDEKEVQDMNGVMTKIKVSKEPLSCDYRMPLSKAKKLELPRLASALIGCSYDELVRRQRAYRMRRVMILSTLLILAAVGFGTYMTISKRKVDAALEQAMINQSRYLATESNNLFEAERRSDALYLALAALPQGEGDDRPVTGEAMSALTRATYAYRGLNGMSLASVWDYTTGSDICGFWVDEEATKLAAVDELGVITVWNTENHNVLYTIDDNRLHPLKCIFISGTLVVESDDEIVGFNEDTGEQIWYMETRGSMDDFSTEEILVLDDNHIICARNDDALLIVNTDNGDLEREIVLPDSVAESRFDDNSFYYTGFSLSPDKTKLAYRGFTSITQSSAVGIYDLEREEVLCTYDMDEYVEEVNWIDDNNIMAISYDISSYDSTRFVDSYVLTPTERTVYCFNAHNMDLKWSVGIVCTSLNVCSGFIWLEANHMVAFYVGNRCVAFDINSGEILYDWYTNESIVHVSDRDGDGWPLMITRGGGMIFPSPSLNNSSIRLTYEFVDHISSIIVNHGVYLTDDSARHIICYNTGVCDEDWNETSGVGISYPSEYYLDDNILALLSGLVEDMKITLIDPNTNSLIAEIPLDEFEVYSSQFAFLGTDDSNLYVSVTNYSEGIVLFTIDLSDGSYETEVLNDHSALADYSVSYSDGMLCYVCGTLSDPQIAIRPATGGRPQSFSAPIEDIADITAAPQYYERAELIYVPCEGGDYIIDTESDSCTRVNLPEFWDYTTMIEYDTNNNRFIVSDSTRLVYVDAETCEITFNFDTDGMTVVGYGLLSINETEYLIVIYDGGHMYRYDAVTGDYIDNMDISGYINHIPEAAIYPDVEAGYMYVQQDHLTSIIDLSCWYEVGFIENSLGHHSMTDRFYSLMYDNSSDVSVGYFRHYTLQELIDKANEILGGIPMPEELRNIYAIDG